MTILRGDCLDILPLLDAESVDAVVTDPPYGLSFMGKAWDHDVPSVEIWREVFRVMKPGAHLLAFFGTRTYHRGVVAIEDAGFEIRDQVQWLFGSGFPKSHDVSKAIDKTAGAEREVVGSRWGKGGENLNALSRDGNDAPDAKGLGAYGQGAKQVSVEIPVTAPATDAAAHWEGWGTALKPANEPIVVARKPLAGTVAKNVLAYGTGAINIDGCRVEAPDGVPKFNQKGQSAVGCYGDGLHGSARTGEMDTSTGRFPANVIHDGSDEVLEAFPDAKGQQGDIRGTEPSRTGGEGTVCYGEYSGRPPATKRVEIERSAARFFYCAKANKKDRDDGLTEFAALPSPASEFRPNHTEKAAAGETGNPYGRWKPQKNTHPTVKPTDLMRYLCRLVTPPGGLVLDPFAGSGSTGRGAILEGFDFLGIEMEPEYVAIAEARIAAARRRFEMEAFE